LFIQEDHLPRFDEVIYLFTNAAVVDDVKSLYQTIISIEPELEKHKVDDAVTVDKKRDNNNDFQRSEEENNQQLQPTTNTVF